MESSSASGPGTLRAGSFLSSDAYIPNSRTPVVARPAGGVVCGTCKGVVVLDAELQELGRLESTLLSATVGPTSPAAEIAVAPDGAIYVGTARNQLYALSPTGEQRWTAQIAADTVVARTEGAYADANLLSMGVQSHPILRFDAATGTSQTITTGQELRASTQGGLITAERQEATIEGAKSVTLRRLDLNGGIVWSHTLSASDGSLQLNGVAGSPDDGVVVWGVTSTTLELGDRTLPVAGSHVSFVAVFDAVGATRGAFVVDRFPVASLAVTSRGEIVVGGTTSDSVGAGNSDVHLAVATPAGITRTLEFDGPGGQWLHGLATASDGAVWLLIANSPPEDGWSDPVMHIDGRTFGDIGMYLFELVP